MSWNLEGKKALISGGTTGIGAATAIELLSLGAEVWVTGRNKEKGDDLLRQCKHPFLHFIQADCSTEKGILKALEGMDVIDILVNNVGINIRRPMDSFTDDQFHEMIQSNVYSAWKMAQCAFPKLEKNKGVLIQVSSVSGLTHVRSGVVYGLTKAALIQLTKNLAAEWGPKGIRVNTVSPWYIKTPLTASILQNESFVQEIENRTPLKKLGEPEDVAAVIAFLAMEKAKYLTGQNIAIDGGFSIYGF